MKSDTSYKPENGDQLGKSYNRNDAELYALYNLLDYDELYSLCRRWHLIVMTTDLLEGASMDISNKYNKLFNDLKKFVQERNMEDALSHVTEESRNHYYNFLFYIFILALQNQNLENAGAVALSTKLRQFHFEKCPTFNFLYIPEMRADGVPRQETPIEIFCREFAIPIKLCFFNQISKDIISDKKIVTDEEFDEIDSKLMQKHSEHLEQLVAKKIKILEYTIYFR